MPLAELLELAATWARSIGPLPQVSAKIAMGRLARELEAVDPGNRWGIWITQGSVAEARSYWYMGPAYGGNYATSRQRAEREAARLTTLCPQWTYEARRYPP